MKNQLGYGVFSGSFTFSMHTRFDFAHIIRKKKLNTIIQILNEKVNKRELLRSFSKLV